MSKLRKPVELKFKIEAYSPETMPMGRLAEYMAGLARFLGEQPRVHFVKLEKGSTVLVHRIETEAVPKVRERIDRVKKGDAEVEEMGAYSKLNEMLREDNGVGLLIAGTRGKLLKFPGREVEPPIAYGSFGQEGTIDGIPIRIGGKNEVVPITIEEENREFSCEARREIAKEIARYLFTTPLRLSGRGRWHREPDGKWILDSFRISGFRPLKDTPLSHVVAELRAVQGNEWSKLEDPWAELNKLRHGTNGEGNGSL